MDYAKLGEKLRQIREDAGLSLDDLAARVDAGRAALAHYEAARRRPDLERISEIVAACGWEVEMLFRRRGEGDAVTALYAATAALRPAEVRLLTRIARLLSAADPDFLVTLGIEVGHYERRLPGER